MSTGKTPPSAADIESARILIAEVEREAKRKNRRESLVRFLSKIVELEKENARYKVTLQHISANDRVKNDCCARALANDHLLDHFVAAASLALKAVDEKKDGIK